MQNLTEFVEYVWSFYAPNSELYPIKGLTRLDIFSAFETYIERIELSLIHI